nr:2-oxo acid dehydrogenase subunit E2 [Actinomycetota bacterium]
AEGAPPLTGEAAGPAAGWRADDEEEVPLTAIRRITARRLTESAAAPHFHLTAVIDAGPLLAFRSDVNGRMAAAGTKVSVTDLLVRACAVTLRMHPQVNASWAGDKIIVHRRIHVGLAVAVDDGLIVPVIRDADRKTLSETAAEARGLADRARGGKLTPEELTGSTFTISNLGMFGVDSFSAVINPPEAAILAVGAAAEEPVIRDGQVAAGMTIRLTLTSDHRVLDGATAAAFLRDLKDALQEPLRIVI